MGPTLGSHWQCSQEYKLWSLPPCSLTWGEEAKGQGEKELAAQEVSSHGEGWFGPQVTSETPAGRPLRKDREVRPWLREEKVKVLGLF